MKASFLRFCRNFLATFLLPIFAFTASERPTAAQSPVVLPDSAVAFRPHQHWWAGPAADSIRSDSQPLQVRIEDLLIRALQHSSQVRVFSELPLIRETSIVEADAAFDWHAFLDSRWDDTSDPVGNSLTVGPGSNRFNDHNVTASLGARRRTQIGGQLEVAQRFGFQDNNSEFFLPEQQGTSRLVLSYTQPLMRGRGSVYNNSLKVLACIDTDIARDEFNRQLQSHLLEVVRAYWGLYLERGLYTQKAEAVRRAETILARLQRRSGIDAYQSQLISAEAEVKNLRSGLFRSKTAVLNAEDRLRALINDPGLGSDGVEIVPLDLPTCREFPVSMEDAMQTAVRSRPEIQQSLKQIKASCVRVNMSKHELMPVLNLVTEAYVSGLRGEGNVGGAVGDQFSTGAPSYSIGLQFEVPINNRAARARHTRRRLELRQLQSQFETTMETLRLETRVAVREVLTSFDELDTKYSAMMAMRAKEESILRRWELLPNAGVTGAQMLENLLVAQSQLAATENDYLMSVVTYNLALMNLKRATGELLQYEQVSIGRGQMNCLPTHVLDKPQLENHGVSQEMIMIDDLMESRRDSVPPAATPAPVLEAIDQIPEQSAPVAVPAVPRR